MPYNFWLYRAAGVKPRLRPHIHIHYRNDNAFSSAHINVYCRPQSYARSGFPNQR
jgi:hypothetical protein